MIRRSFHAENIANVTTFCKRLECWHQIRELDPQELHNLEIPDEDLINKQQQKDQAYEAKELGKAGAYLGVAARVEQVSENEWKELIGYLKDEEGLPFKHKNVDLVRQCVYQHQGLKVLSGKQAKSALEIREWALSRNFTYFE